jgi:hypothetical protein
LIGEMEKAAKEVQANPREPQRIPAENGGHVITKFRQRLQTTT